MNRFCYFEVFELNAWVLKANPEIAKRETILVVNSDAGNMDYSLPYVFHLLRAGFEVVTFDYRGFGSSADFAHKQNNVYHRECIDDFVAALRFCQATVSGEEDWITSDGDAQLVVAMKEDRKRISYAGDHLKGAAVLGFGEYVRRICDFLN